MNQKLFRYMNKNELNVAIFDVDGTIKNLVRENNDAIEHIVEKSKKSCFLSRGLIRFINRIAMYIVKTGVLPTNKYMQNILLWVYSVMIIKRPSNFFNDYINFYHEECNLFNSSKSTIRNLIRNGNRVYLLSNNSRNSKIGDLFDEKISAFIVEDRKYNKYYLYRDVIKVCGVDTNDLVIIGDNFWDDVLPAIILSVKVIWCNKYNSKVKYFFRWVLSKLNKNVWHDKEEII